MSDLVLFTVKGNSQKFHSRLVANLILFLIMTKKYPMSTYTEWRANLETFEDDIQENEAKFVFDQAEKLLKDIVDTNVLIINRTTTLITLVVGFMLALISYSINRWTLAHEIDSNLITALIVFIYYFYLANLLRRNIQSKEYGVCGAQPKDLLVSNFYVPEVPKEKRIIHFYYSEIDNYQRKIEANKITNDERWALFNKSLKGLVLSPLVIPIVYMLIKFLILAFGCAC